MKKKSLNVIIFCISALMFIVFAVLSMFRIIPFNFFYWALIVVTLVHFLCYYNVFSNFFNLLKNKE